MPIHIRRMGIEHVQSHSAVTPVRVDHDDHVSSRVDVEMCRAVPAARMSSLTSPDGVDLTH